MNKIEYKHTSGVQYVMASPIKVYLPFQVRGPAGWFGTKHKSRPPQPAPFDTLDPKLKEEWEGIAQRHVSIGDVGSGVLSEVVQLKIDAGFAHDGASGPTINTRSTWLAATVHDALYWWLRNDPRFRYSATSGEFTEVYAERFGLRNDWRKYADGLFYMIARINGMNPIRARLWYRALRLAGGDAADHKSRRKIYSIKAKWPGGRE